ncbi:FIST N-terminal domain-containing protein [Sulfurospirillum multivorans]|uniref:histidine kinase n=2 Tax=Sulfurospirillum multivorans TaxID=66821 RepID=A0AA86APE3_SULMK|nr:FIST N-terminal domain-containing protein [Sulfurospirillum multivorans]AHJ13357.1 histidine kinase [Sulfurospirillum multivorans DSM 12446]QEH06847.1 histidine kinase [Sulfurospirillum multivorans]
MKTYNFCYETGSVHSIIDFSLFETEKNVLVQLFCGQGKAVLQEISDIILTQIPHAICIGTTTDGEIFGEAITTLRTVISISIFENTFIKTAYSNHEDSFQCGVNIASDLVSSNTKLLILFSDGTRMNAEEFLKGVESYDATIPICGGMAGDNGKFEQTYISSQKTLLGEGVVGISLNSDALHVATDYKFDWKPIGLKHTITKVTENRVYLIDGMKAAEFYDKYLGGNFSQTEFPLILEKYGVTMARAVIAKHNDGSLSYSGNFSEGDKVRIGFGDAESLMKDPIDVLENLHTINAETYYVFSCMARRRFMPFLIKLGIGSFSKTAATSGFFTYSEFYHQNGHNKLLNQTLTVVALSESITNTAMATSSNKEEIKKKTPYSKTIESLTHLIEQSARDYDEQSKRLEKQRRYSNTLLASHKQFLRYTVHEMNTPLSVIMNNIELHEMEFGKSTYLENIEVAAKSIFSMYDDLSYLVKKDQINYVKRPIDLIDYIRCRIDFFAQVADKAKSMFLFETNCNEAMIFFNETKLQRIIDNNLTNAIKYTFENEKIVISIYKDADSCHFCIASHSRKIQKPEKIFEEFYREEEAQDGFGLGLNLVKRICKEENVKITLHSDEAITSFSYQFKIEDA